MKAKPETLLHLATSVRNWSEYLATIRDLYE